MVMLNGTAGVPRRASPWWVCQGRTARRRACAGAGARYGVAAKRWRRSSPAAAQCQQMTPRTTRMVGRDDYQYNLAHNVISDTKWTNFEETATNVGRKSRQDYKSVTSSPSFYIFI